MQFRLYDGDTGEVLLVLRDFRFMAMSPQGKALHPATHTLVHRWREQPVASSPAPAAFGPVRVGVLAPLLVKGDCHQDQSNLAVHQAVLEICAAGSLPTWIGAIDMVDWPDAGKDGGVWTHDVDVIVVPIDFETDHHAELSWSHQTTIRGLERVLEMLRAVGSASARRDEGLVTIVLVSRNAHHAVEADAGDAVVVDDCEPMRARASALAWAGGAALWSMLRTARLEFRTSRLRLVALDSDQGWSSSSEVSRLLAQVGDEVAVAAQDAGAQAASEVAWVRNARFVPGTEEYSIDFGEPRGLTEKPFAAPADLPHVVVITGGLGGLGLVTAQELADLGARHLVLVSRSGVVKYDGQGLGQRLEALQQLPGVNVVLEACDVSEEDQVMAMLERVRSSCGPITAVFHAAGTTSDGLIRSAQSVDALTRVFGPKASGAWFLHKHTLSDPVKGFVLFSSVASHFGNVGQANYSAANGFLDGLARWRVDHGMPAVSVQWPAVTGVGMAAAMDERSRVPESLSIAEDTVRNVIRQVSHGTVPATVFTLVPHAFYVQRMPTRVSPAPRNHVMFSFGLLDRTCAICRSCVLEWSRLFSSPCSNLDAPACCLAVGLMEG